MLKRELEASLAMKIYQAVAMGRVNKSEIGLILSRDLEKYLNPFMQSHLYSLLQSEPSNEELLALKMEWALKAKTSVKITSAVQKLMILDRDTQKTIIYHSFTAPILHALDYGNDETYRLLAISAIWFEDKECQLRILEKPMTHSLMLQTAARFGFTLCFKAQLEIFQGERENLLALSEYPFLHPEIESLFKQRAMN